MAKPRSQPAYRLAPLRTVMFDGQGNMTQPWNLYFQNQAQAGGPTVVVGFIMNSGATGTNVGPMLPAPRDATADVVTVVIQASDPSVALTFRINQAPLLGSGLANDPSDIFLKDPTIAAATPADTVFQFTNLTTSPLPVAYNDLFSIDITSGSSFWKFTAVLETQG